MEQTCPSPPYLVGHLLGGAIATRFAIAHSEKLRGLVLADTFGLCRLRPSPLFTLTMINFLARPTAGSRDRFFRHCFVDMNRLQDQLGPLWQPLMTYALEGANSPDQKAALRRMMPELGWRAIPEKGLAKISAPTTLIWGRRPPDPAGRGSASQPPLRMALAHHRRRRGRPRLRTTRGRAESLLCRPIPRG